MTSDFQHPSDFIPEIARQRAELRRQEEADPRRRILVIGVPGCGKTYAGCTTAPGPIVIDYDNQLDDPRIYERLLGEFPMWNDKFVTEDLKLKGTPLQRFEGVLALLAPKLTPAHTIIIDSMSTLADRLKENLEARLPTEGRGDNYWFWREWAKAWRKVCTLVKDVQCNVYFTAHESEVRDEESGRLQKYGWILQGKEFTPRVPQFFTDVVRMRRSVTANKEGAVTAESWLWQIRPTAEFPYAKSRCRLKQMEITASWGEIIK